MLKKAQFLVMLAVVVLSATLLFSFGSGLVRTVSYVDTGVHGSLPTLAESTAPGLLDPAASQTDNATLPATSSGAVKASFTVILLPGGEHAEESVTSSTANGEDGPGSASVAIPAQETKGVTTDLQTRNDLSVSADNVSPKCGVLSLSWALLMGVGVVGIATVGVLAFGHFRAGKSESPGQRN